MTDVPAWLRRLADRIEKGAYHDAESVIVSFYKDGILYGSEGCHKRRDKAHG